MPGKDNGIEGGHYRDMVIKVMGGIPGRMFLVIPMPTLATEKIKGTIVIRPGFGSPPIPGFS